ncbi:hypothetical protein JXD38_03940 [candidate division WOR-3 bacterium]|nr:hypothetical protein [candidate division WOR-3 bacterium]
MLLLLAMLSCAGAGSASPITTHSHTYQSYLPVTSVKHVLARFGPVGLTAHDVSGRLERRLETGSRPAGRHVARWNGTDVRGHKVPSGVYFVRLNAGGETTTRRVTLIR